MAVDDGDKNCISIEEIFVKLVIPNMVVIWQVIVAKTPYKTTKDRPFPNFGHTPHELCLSEHYLDDDTHYIRGASLYVINLFF